MKQLFENWREFLLLEAEGKKVDELATMYDDPLLLRHLKSKSLKQKHFNWLYDRFSENPIKEEEDYDIYESLTIIWKFAEKEGAIAAKWKSNPKFKETVEKYFPSSERKWNHPVDIVNMSATQLQTLTDLVEKKEIHHFKLGACVKEEEFLVHVDGWNLWMPITRESSCKIAGYNPVSKRPYTHWCTARTGADENLFYKVLGAPSQNQVVFYTIKGPPPSPPDENGCMEMEDELRPDRDPKSRLSVGWVNGEPVMNNSTLSVDGHNTYISQQDFYRAVGRETANKLFAEMQKRVSSLGGKHPAQEKMKQAVKDPKVMDSLLAGLGESSASSVLRTVWENYSDQISPEVLIFLSRHRYPASRKVAAGNSNTPPQVLAALVKDKNEGVATDAIANKNSPIEEVSSLIVDEESFRTLSRTKKSYLASNPGISPELLRKLYEDNPTEHSSNIVLLRLSLNPSLPPDIMKRLAFSKDDFTAEGVLENPGLPLDLVMVLAEKYTKSRDDHALAELVNNSSLPLKALEFIADFYFGDVGHEKHWGTSTGETILISIVRHPNTTPELLGRMHDETKQDPRRWMNLPYHIRDELRSSAEKKQDPPMITEVLEETLNTKDQTVESTLKEHFNNWREFIKNS